MSCPYFYPIGGVDILTNEQKQQILDMRQQGLGYGKIASALGISENTVKSYCRRNKSAAHDTSNAVGNKESNVHNESENNESIENRTTCKNCAKPLNQKPKVKPKTFCNDKCRFDWWNNHRCQIKKEARRDKRAV